MKIDEITGINLRTVSELLKRVSEYGNIKNHPRRHKTTACSDSMLFRMVKKTNSRRITLCILKAAKWVFGERKTMTSDNT